MIDFKSLLLVAFGGAMGASSRYLVVAWLQQISPTLKFPIGTFFVNSLGSLLAGIAIVYIQMHLSGSVQAENARLFLVVGILGGFTTFSALNLEVMELFKQGETFWATLYIFSSAIVGFGSLLTGVKLMELLLR